MSNTRVRGMPIDKIFIMRAQPHQPREQQEELSKEEAHTPDRPYVNDYSECSIDSDLAILPPPRRSLASRLNPGESSNNRKLIMKWIICLSAVFLFLHFVPRYQKPKEVQLTLNPAILLWNEESSTARLRTHQCHCAVTKVRNYTDRAIDAVIVNADRPYSIEGLEKIVSTPNFLLVFAAKQPLSLAKNPVSAHGESVFNYTMTYRLDSDLVWTDYYFSTIHNEHERLDSFEAPVMKFMDSMPANAAAHLRFKLQLKHHVAVYMTYDVNDASVQQSNYLEQLRGHMDLHVIQTCHETNECIPYRFMLIFEPSCCPDYVHPQFYMALANFVVPVLLSDCNLANLVPPNSYISGADFSPADLAKHLNTLSTHPPQYEQFFWWHAKYQIHQILQPYCALCRQLRMTRRQPQPYAIYEWWTLYQCPEPEFQIEKTTRGNHITKI